MSKLSEEDIYEALSLVKDPELNRDLVSLNMVRDVQHKDGGNVSLEVVLTTPACPLRDRIEADVQAGAKAVPGVKSRMVEMDAEVSAVAALRGPQPIEGVQQHHRRRQQQGRRRQDHCRREPGRCAGQGGRPRRPARRRRHRSERARR